MFATLIYTYYTRIASISVSVSATISIKPPSDVNTFVEEPRLLIITPFPIHTATPDPSPTTNSAGLNTEPIALSDSLILIQLSSAEYYRVGILFTILVSAVGAEALLVSAVFEPIKG